MVHINKEQRWDVITFVALEHMVDGSNGRRHVGLGWRVRCDNIRCKEEEKQVVPRTFCQERLICFRIVF